VYGASNFKERVDFLVELVQVLSINHFPFMFAGDFNLVRRASERNKVKRVSKRFVLFNSITEHWVSRGWFYLGDLLLGRTTKLTLWLNYTTNFWSLLNGNYNFL
jgi:hypothetical protein